MSEHEQGEANDASAQPRWQAYPPPVSADLSDLAGASTEQVSEVAVPADPPDAGEPAGTTEPAVDTEQALDTGPADRPEESHSSGEAVGTGELADDEQPSNPTPAPLTTDKADPAATGAALRDTTTQQGEQGAPVPDTDQPSIDPGPSVDVQAAVDVVSALGEDLKSLFEREHEQLLTLAAGITEANRLRSRDQAHVEQLHTDNTTLRRGELTSAMAPLLTGLVRLADQMASMAAGDKHSIAGMLRAQLLQTLDVAAGVTEYSPAEGDTFDSKTMTGAAREETTAPDRDGTVARTVRSGFTRADGSVMRVAEVVVRRLAPTTRPAPAGSEQ